MDGDPFISHLLTVSGLNESRTIMWKHIVAQVYYLSFLRFVNCCHCDFNHTDGGIEKRQLEESTTEFFDKTAETNDLMETSLYMSVTTIPHSMFFETNETTTESRELEANKSHTMFEESNKIDNIFDLNENSSEVVEFNVSENTFETMSDLGKTDIKETTTESVRSVKKTEKQQSKELWKKCRQYKNGDSFNLAKMADVWQVVYYRLANKLKCFKLHIKPVTPKDQRRYARVYGSFNETVAWNRCFLEITSSEKEHRGRRHFLQGTQADKGIMENVIIDEEYCRNTTYLTLHRESGDQWLVIGKLLVMRDCHNGDFVVFTKVPLQPRKSDIMDALKKFGLNYPNGTMACNVEKSWLKYEEGSFT